jgi:hypothetical protein
MDSQGNSVKLGSFHVGQPRAFRSAGDTKTRATKALRIVFPYAMVRLVSLDP